ncbi:MAG TPA: exonuclease SbcCD subunit D [Herpetosiphonaceae bacterium]|nr:exonuclease SbcCD subunit D [Herpetosiphonaceae bacterium]
MPKMLHLADLHIGMENYGRTDPATGLNTRLLDYLARLDQVLDYALVEDPVDLVLIAGDIYKSRTPNPTHQREFARRIKRVLRARVPVVILTGNHDMPAASGRAHSVEIFDALAVDGVTIASRMRTYTIDTRNGPVQIVAVPWLNRHALLTKDDLQGLPMTAVDAEMLHRVEDWLERAVATLDPEIPTVLTFHGTLAGATYGSERAVMLGHDLILPRSVIAQPGIDYVALGHIHKHQVIGGDPPAVYPGSLERVDFGEEHEIKGFVVVDLQKGATTWRFVEVAARPFVTIEVDVRQSPDPHERIRRAIAKQRLADAIVRVLVKCLPQQRVQIDERVIREEIEASGAVAIAMVALEVERVSRGRFDAVADELQGGLTPRRALELYLRTKEVPPTRQERLLSAADELLREE